jgi:glycosyltransferase involved in cell wall biosynthesis
MLLVHYINYYKQKVPDSRHMVVLLKNRTDLLHTVQNRLEGVEVIPFDKKNMIKGLRAWKKLVRTYRPNLIHTHLFYPCMLARLGTPRPIPVVSTYHNQSYCKASPYYSPWFGFLDRLTFRNSCYRIFVSQAVQQCVENATGIRRNSAIIGNFVSTNFYPAWTLNLSKGLRLVAVGSLKKVKNHALLIDALKLIPTLDISVDIYGEGELRNQLQHGIDDAGLQVRLCGNQKLTSEMLQHYDAFVMPSLSEGQPVSLLEAMTTGLPSLLSDIPSLRDVAAGAALYFSPSDPAGLAEEISSIIQNKALLAQLSETALKRAAPYSIHNYFTQTAKLYTTALRQKDT